MTGTDHDLLRDLRLLIEEWAGILEANGCKSSVIDGVEIQRRIDEVLAHAPEPSALRTALLDIRNLHKTEGDTEQTPGAIHRAIVVGIVDAALAASLEPAAKLIEQLRAVPTHVVLDVAEIPGRDSPDDRPEMMLVTDKELAAIVANRINAALSLSGTKEGK